MVFERDCGHPDDLAIDTEKTSRSTPNIRYVLLDGLVLESNRVFHPFVWDHPVASGENQSCARSETTNLVTL